MIESIAIGSFDGVHIAHQKLIEIADAVVVIERFSATLTAGWKRSLYIDKPCYFYLLEKIQGYSPKEFIEHLLLDFPNLKRVVVGYDFFFGRDKAGSIETLKRYFHGEVVVVPEVKYNEISVHTRVIREYLYNSDIDMVRALLGRRYRIDGKQIRGLGLGSKELVPTINLNIEHYVLPMGVFAVYVEINAIRYGGVLFIGNRVSVDNSFSIEVHILEEFQKEIREFQTVWVEFAAFIRDIKSFDSFAMLKSAIKSDIDTAKSLLQLSN
ncbi:MAG TPA: bifunctional riboflavin kinase/FAD synthetase [Nitratifractor sp.]|nr:bifunctional riboflavin kinase/FAD synthetase [Nitratifractor sp.]